jgi:PTS hybrid protein
VYDDFFRFGEGVLMRGVLLVSHSQKLAEGTRDLLYTLAPEVPVAPVGGIDDERLGTEPFQIVQAIESLEDCEEIFVLFDLGSSYMNAEIAVEMAGLSERKVYHYVDAPFVEGGIVLAIELAANTETKEIFRELEKMTIHKIR